MTRAKKKIFLLTVPNKKSNFIVELEDALGKIERCPECKTGYLVEREGEYGLFFGCSNYPYCKYSKKINEDTNGISEDVPF